MQRTLLTVSLLLLLATVAATPTPGPDTSDQLYRTKDSTGAGFGPAMNWNWASIHTNGVDQRLPDDGSKVVNLGFDFEFYGQTYSQATMHANGLLQFGGTATSVESTQPRAIPSTTGTLHNFIAAYWSDLVSSCPDAKELIRTEGSAPNRVFVAQWHLQTRERDEQTCTEGGISFSFQSNPVQITAQVRLYETSNNIEVYLRSTPTDGNAGGGRPSVTGIEDSSGTIGLAYNTPGNNAYTDRAIRFFPNHAPETTDKTVTTLEDNAVDFTLPATDQDLDTMTYSYDASSVVGTISGTAPELTYTPPANHFGSGGSLTFTATDSLGFVSTASTVTFDVTSVNDAPSFIAGPDVSVEQDSGAYSKAWATGIAPGPFNEFGQQLTFTATPTDASLFASPPAISPSGVLSFTPKDGAFGQTNVLVSLQDDGGTDNGGQDTAPTTTFVIEIEEFIAPPNQVPEADNLNYFMNEDESITIMLTGTDGDGDPLTFFIPDMPIGSLLLQAPGIYTYTPPADFNGLISFLYVANDGEDDSTPAAVNIDVAPVNDGPIGSPDVFTVTEGESIDIYWLDVLANDEDIDGDPLGILWSAPSIGEVTGTDPLTYTAPDFFSGEVTMSYFLTDGIETVEVPVSIFVQERANNAPQASDDVLQMERGSSMTLDPLALMANDADPDGDPLTFAFETWPSLGAWDGTTYTPPIDFAGSVTFTYEIQDGRGGVDYATITIGVLASEPIAAFTWLAPVDPIAVGHTVTFMDQSLQAGEEIVAWEWSIQGTNHFGKEVQHQVTKLGAFTATLKITDALGRTSTTSQELFATHRQPIAFFVPDAGPYAIGQIVTFHDMSRDDGTIANVAWDYGDGTSNGLGVHTYQTAGAFTVRLTVTDDQGAIGTTQLLVHVKAAEAPVTIAEPSLGGGNQAASFATLAKPTAPEAEIEPEPAPVEEEVQVIQAVNSPAEVQAYEPVPQAEPAQFPWKQVALPLTAATALIAFGMFLWLRKLA